jgi:energy-coupling factor transport system permease protein
VSLAMGVPVRPTPVTRANPVAKLAAAVVITMVLLLSVDWVSASTALALELVALPLSGLAARELVRRTAPVWVTAGPAGLVTTLLGQDSGDVLLDVGPLEVSDGSVTAGLAITLRVLAVGLPGVLLLVSTDPTDLADALAQRLRLPHRFVLGALAGLRMVGLMVVEWRTLTLARRARGVGDHDGPLGSARVLAGQSFALLVLALRRGARLAVAMEARGFGAPVERTWARPSRFAARDAVLVAGAVLVAAAAVTAAVLAGTWSFVLA